MSVNVGTLDRILRAVLGVVLLYLALVSDVPAFAGGFVKYGAIIVGVVMLIVAAVRICPIYSAIGIRTNKII